jgi:activator of HSP90 ATPase
MSESLHIIAVLSASPERLYNAWLDSGEHSHFTGGKAEIDARPGGAFTAWDGYIQGVTLELEPFKRIVQSWRTTDFPDDCPDSRLEVVFRQVKNGTEMQLIHTGLPDGQAKSYEDGWCDYYLTPMQAYFAPDEDI